MKEKYIFFTLLIVAVVMLVGSQIGGKGKGDIYTEELPIEKRLKRAAQQEPRLPEKIDIDKIQDLVAISYYEGLLERSPFFQVQPEPVKDAPKANREVLPVEEKTPLFVYKGKIGAGKRLLVIIEQTRSGEVFMVSQGENIDGYKVLEISDGDVVLSKDGEENIVIETVEKP